MKKTYRGYDIEIEETRRVQHMSESDENSNFVVSSTKCFYYASSNFGMSFALDGPSALEGAKKIIDQALDE